MGLYNYKLTSTKGNVYLTTAETDEKAMTSFKRKRNKYKDSYASIAQGTIEKLDEVGSTVKGLTEILFKETQSLKEQYLQKTEEWAKKSFARYEELNHRTIEEWYNAYEIKYAMKEQYGKIYPSVDNSEYHRKNLSKMKSNRDKIEKVVRGGEQAFVEKQLKLAEEHYKDSILKLASKIRAKGLIEDKLEVKTSHIGMNIDTVLSDGEQTVKAFTILAHGEINAPHYRYLIK